MSVLQLGLFYLYVCMFVCLSIRSQKSKTNCQIFLKISQKVGYIGGSVLLKDDPDLDPDPDLMA